MVNHGKYKKHSWFVGIVKKFQWLGFMISTDNPITYNGLYMNRRDFRRKSAVTKETKRLN